MATTVSIWNMALGHIGAANVITDDSDAYSEEAAACRTFWDDVVRAVYAGKAWDFAKRRAALALVQAQPNDDWAYEYQMPDDCPRIIRLLTPGSQDQEPSTPFERRWTGTRDVIWTDLEDAYIEFVDGTYPESRWPGDFVLAVSLLLGHFISPRVKGSAATADALYQRYLAMMNSTIGSQQTQQRRREDADPEAIRARG